MMRRCAALACFLTVVVLGCANIETDSGIELKAKLNSSCQITATTHKGYYIGVDTCLSDNAFKANLQKKIRVHRVLHYTQNNHPIPDGFTIAFMTLDNGSYTIPSRFDVWDAYRVFAAKGANPHRSGGNCPIGKLLDWYDYQCYDLPATIFTPNCGGQQNGTSDGCTNTDPISPSTLYGNTGVFDREHSWPASWFRSATESNNPSNGSYCYNGNLDSTYGNFEDFRAATDLHHLIPARRALNFIRSNYVPGIVQTPDSGDWPRPNGANFGTPDAGHPLMAGFPGATGNAAKVFTPPTELRGDFARNYFYMATRYYTEDTCWNTNEGVTRANINTWLENLLRNWHANDPVSDEERTRNDWIERIQGNRNPFVDHPEWVDKISDF
jgi:hypothetical protein